MMMADSAVVSAVSPSSPNSYGNGNDGFMYDGNSPNPANNGNGQMSFDEDEDDKSMEAVKPWDEGGQSDCGYSDSVHSTLMTVGKTVHLVMGAPGSKIAQVQTSIGNWFQELSYAARDIVRGEHGSMQQDAANAIKTVMTGGIAEEDDLSVNSGKNGANGTATNTSTSMLNTSTINNLSSSRIDTSIS